MKNNHNNGHQRCPTCNTTQTSYYDYRDTTQSDVYICIAGCGEFPVPTLEIPTPSEYHANFWKDNNNLSPKARELAGEFIKSITALVYHEFRRK